IGTLIDVYRDHDPVIKLAPDAQAALRQIGPECPVAIITDGPLLSQQRKCEALRLADVAWPLILTEQWGSRYRKPHRRSYEHVATSIQARRFVYVADNPAKDFNAPKELGWLTVRVRRAEGLHFHKSNEIVTPDAELPSCSSLLQVLSQL